jgi:hypothetical protein
MDPCRSSLGRSILMVLVFMKSDRAKDSAFWSDLFHVRYLYLCGRKTVVGNGKCTSFLGDA